MLSNEKYIDNSENEVVSIVLEKKWRIQYVYLVLS